MKALIQRVKRAAVDVNNKKITEIDRGLLVFLGVVNEDNEKDIKYLAEKIANMRLFQSKKGEFDLSVKDVGGEVLMVSQFTLCANCKKGRRPDFTQAANPEKAKDLYEKTIKAFKNAGIVTKNGEFRSFMEISLVNDGPVTIYLDSKN